MVYDNTIIISGATFSNPNACAHRMLGIAKLFSNFSKSITLIGVSDNNESGFFYSFPYYTTKKPISIFDWIVFTFSPKRYIYHLKKKAGKTIVIINASVPSIPAIRIANYCVKKSIKCIMDIDEWYAKSPDFFPRNVIKNLDTSIRMNRICKIYKDYIVSSNFLLNYCGKDKNIFVFPAIVSEKIQRDQQEQQDLYINHAIKILFAGKPEKNNLKENLDNVIAAINIVNKEKGKRFNLEIVGTDGNNSEFIHYHGKLPYDECVKFLLSADFTIIPRDRTRKNNAGFPTKLSESFLYGVPVISTDTSDIKEYLIDGINGFLLINNEIKDYINAFKKIRASISCDPNYIHTLKNNTIKYNKLRIELFVDRFLSFIKKV